MASIKMELIEKLGIDWRLLIAQIINFLVLFFVLTKFAFRPLIKMLDERSRRIEQSLEEAEKIKKMHLEATAQKEAIILEARHSAKDIISESKKQAEEVHQKLTTEAQNEVAKMLESGRLSLAAMKEKMSQELQKEVGDLVVEATRKVMLGTVDQKVDREYVNRILHV